jgi:hypothetical protein
MKEHEEIFNNILSSLHDLTQNGEITWSINHVNNDLIFEFIGEDNTKYTIKYEWRFGNDGWDLRGGDLHIKGKEEISLWKWKWEKLVKIQKLMLSNYEFKPNDSDVIKNLKDMSNSISKMGQRDNKITQIFN